MVLKRRKILFLAFGMLVLTGMSVVQRSAFGAGGLSMIRDTEIENTIRAYAAPLLSAAGLEPDAFHVHLVNSTELNAFVAQGQRLFITTGLLRRSRNADQVIAVMAHEIGHIAGGHLARLKGALDDASTAAMITQVLGLAIGVLSRQGGAAIAVGGGGQHVIERSLLSYSRGQEQAADQAAVSFLDQAGLSSRGMAQFLNILANQEFLHSSRQEAYVRTHPLTRERVRFAKRHFQKSRFANAQTPRRFIIAHELMVAKLNGFMGSPPQVLMQYKESDHSVSARYARTIAEYRNFNLEAAVPMIDALIAEHPRNPYFFELKGQMLFENARIDEALIAYRESVRLLPRAPLLRTSLAHAMLESNRPELLDEALAHANEALRVDRFVPLAWRLAGTVYGRKGQMGRSAWALAEYNLLIGRSKLALSQAKRALKLLKKGSPSWLRAQDIVNQTNRKG
jgi:predicted Zn-dependent protease